MKSRFCLSLAVLAFLLSGCMSDGTDTIVLLFPSSSSEVPSSSSEVPSSSSEAPSSSSSVSNCADFDPEAEVEHYGKMKKQFCDERDGKKYVYVTIGEQTWMAENLNYEAEGGKCYDNNPANCDEYGSMYDWSTAMDFPASCNTSTCSGQIQSPHQGICPDGWHLPSDAEWRTLGTAVGGLNTAGTKLKAESGWNDYNGASGNGTDEFGFSALPGGWYGFLEGSFRNVGIHGNWWVTNENVYEPGPDNYADLRYMDCKYPDVGRNTSYKYGLQSVRCLQD